MSSADKRGRGMVSLLFSLMFQILVMVCLGFFLAKKRMLSESTQTDLTAILVDILTPCSILASSQRPFSVETGESIFICIGASFVFYILALLLCYLIFRVLPIENSKRGVAITSSVFANTAFIGYPLITSLYGSESMLLAAGFGIGYMLFMYTVGVRLFSSEKEPIRLRTILSANVISAILSDIIYFSPYRLPSAVYTVLGLLGDMMVPVSMMIIGASFVGVRLKDVVSDTYAYVVSFIRLVLLPVLVYIGLSLFCVPQIVISICTIMSAIPVGTFNVILAKRYGGNVEFSNQTLIISMLFSLITLPLLIMFLAT